jgi:hypothetical protein
MEINVLNPIRQQQAFKTPDEFNIYYIKHKESMDSESTHQLNKKYAIEGYHIGKCKDKNGLCLKPWLGPRYIKNNEMNKIQEAVELAQDFRIFEESTNRRLAVCLDHLKDLKELETIPDLIANIQDDMERIKSQLSIIESVKTFSRDFNYVRTAVNSLLKYVYDQSGQNLTPK